LFALRCKLLGINRDPVITSLSLSRPVYEDQVGVATCVAHDPDGDNLTYDWLCTASPIYGHTPEVAWDAGAPGLDTVSVTVSDGRGGTATKSDTVTVLQGCSASPRTPRSRPPFQECSCCRAFPDAGGRTFKLVHPGGLDPEDSVPSRWQEVRAQASDKEEGYYDQIEG
jgi:hypothetical protein